MGIVETFIHVLNVSKGRIFKVSFLRSDGTESGPRRVRTGVHKYIRGDGRKWGEKDPSLGNAIVSRNGFVQLFDIGNDHPIAILPERVRGVKFGKIQAGTFPEGEHSR